ncbi:MAG: acyltransferase family protein [Gaiellaceae bacterium]|jgi:peptidoglycan/LPS O-acetylase OafA/YrhL
MARRLDIQGLRALAVLAIVVYHASLPVPGGFIGVDVFFVISGFVIAGTLLRELDSTGQLSVMGFYTRRVKRLLPAPAVMITFVALAGILAAPATVEHMAALTGITSSLFTANFYLAFLTNGYFDPSATLNPLLHTWMLSVIVQLYLIAPVLLIGGWRLGRSRLGRGRSREVTFALIAFLSLASFLLSIALNRGRLLSDLSRDQRLAFYSSPTRAWEFGVGALLVLAAPLLTRLPTWSARALGAAGAVVVGVSAFSIHEVSFSAKGALLPVVGTCLVLGAGIGSQVGVSRLLGLRPLVWLGDISFSLYLWHWPLIVFAKALYPYHPTGTALVAAAVSFLPAWLSYRYVENPIRFSSRLSSRSPLARRAAAALAAVCILLPVGAGYAQLEARGAVDSTSSMKSWLHSAKLNASDLHGCDNLTPLGERTGSACTWKVARSRGTIVLFGDSNAGHFTEPVTRAGNRAGYTVDVATSSSCPYLGLRVASSELGEGKGCPRFSSETLAFLVRSKPSLVILAARTDAYLQGSDFSLGKVGSGALTNDTQAKVRLWQSALTSVLRRLNKAGVPVLLVHPIPVLPNAPNGCAVGRILIGECTSTVPRKTVDSWLALSRRVENASIARAPATWALDFEKEICGESTCSTLRDGVVQYRDYRHLSIAGALMLTDSFYGAIVAHAVQRRRS